MTSLVDAINKSNWADRTKKNRVSLIVNLKKELAPDDPGYKFLRDFDLVSKYVLASTKNPGTRKTKILTIKSILNLIEDKAASKYDKLVNTLVSADDDYKGNNIQVKDTISYEDLVGIPYTIEGQINYVYKKTFLDYKEVDELHTTKAKMKYLRMLTDYVIAVLYCWQPPVRADWATVGLKHSKTQNWYDARKDIIHWNDFKNVKSFGARSFKLEPQVAEILSDFIGVADYIIPNMDKLLYIVSPNGESEFTREKFSVYFSRLMKKYTDKKLSINSIRHIYENHIIKDPKYNQLTINQKRDIHERLLHKLGTAQSYLTV